MKKQVTLYSTFLFPFWFLLLMPNMWLILIATQMIIVSFVLIGALKHIGVDDVPSVWRKSILWNTFYGFLAYLVASGLLVPTQFVNENTSAGTWFLEHITYPVAENPFSGVFAFLYTLLAVAVGALIVYFANRKISFRKTSLTPEQTHKVCLYLAIFSAPYFVFVPSTVFYAKMAGMITML
ncbi:MAG: hypothetical protein E7256_09405 [Lachnospiraceae bacterium]|nr:hypothetical protein [Lachnospiraceae bacterium]